MGYYEYKPVNERVATLIKINDRSMLTATVSYCPHSDSYVVMRHRNYRGRTTGVVIGRDYSNPLDAICAAWKAMPAGSEIM